MQILTRTRENYALRDSPWSASLQNRKLGCIVNEKIDTCDFCDVRIRNANGVTSEHIRNLETTPTAQISKVNVHSRYSPFQFRHMCWKYRVVIIFWYKFSSNWEYNFLTYAYVDVNFFCKSIPIFAYFALILRFSQFFLETISKICGIISFSVMVL